MRVKQFELYRADLIERNREKDSDDGGLKTPENDRADRKLLSLRLRCEIGHRRRASTSGVHDP